MTPDPTTTPDQSAVLGKVSRRLLPLLIVLYVVAFLDRVNIATAALTMNSDLKLSATTYGFVSGSFFLGYVLFQIPANWVFQRLGIRRWFAVLLTAWGVAAAAPAFVTGPTGLVLTRILLGIAEAGFYPAVICYLGRWFPPQARARALALFLLAIPLANIVGMPLSSMLVEHGAVGVLTGWRTMFLVEGLPAIALAVAALRCLPDSPSQARWLTDDDRNTLTRHHNRQTPTQEASFGVALKDRGIIALAAINAGLYFSQFGVQFFLPQIMQRLYPQGSITLIGCLGAICFAVAAVAMLAWGRHSDRRGERSMHLAAPALAAAVVLSFATIADVPFISMAAVAGANVCVLAALPIFCSITTARWNGAASAGGIAAVNSIASLASFAGPYAIGTATDATGGFNAALVIIAAASAGAGIVALSLRAANDSVPSDHASIDRQASQPPLEHAVIEPQRVTTGAARNTNRIGCHDAVGATAVGDDVTVGR